MFCLPIMTEAIVSGLVADGCYRASAGCQLGKAKYDATFKKRVEMPRPQHVVGYARKTYNILAASSPNSTTMGQARMVLRSFLTFNGRISFMNNHIASNDIVYSSTRSKCNKRTGRGDVHAQAVETFEGCFGTNYEEDGQFSEGEVAAYMKRHAAVLFSGAIPLQAVNRFLD